MSKATGRPWRLAFSRVVISPKLVGTHCAQGLPNGNAICTWFESVQPIDDRNPYTNEKCAFLMAYKPQRFCCTGVYIDRCSTSMPGYIVLYIPIPIHSRIDCWTQLDSYIAWFNMCGAGDCVFVAGAQHTRLRARWRRAYQMSERKNIAFANM